MIRGFADAGRIFKADRYLEAAITGANFALKELQQDDGRLSRTYREGRAKLNAYLVDYAFLIDGLIALHRATRDPHWLQAASRLSDKQIELFWDAEDSGFSLPRMITRHSLHGQKNRPTVYSPRETAYRQ